MCGISGLFAYSQAAAQVDREELLRIRDQMAARGPDAAGEWLGGCGRIGLAHRRLSIIDLSCAGAQPMISEDGRLVITFNGEIYNYKELRHQLERKGGVFRSNSDTEVLLQLYAKKGAELVHDLRGMYAFAIWDNELRSLFLARDPYGIKPLYYSDDGHTFRFASQVKALLASNAISRAPDPAGWVGFLLLGNVPSPFTTYRAIKELPAGTVLTLTEGAGMTLQQRYHSIASIYAQAEEVTGQRVTREDRNQLIRLALRDSVKAHLTADVPVGAFLSAGMDSGALVGLMRDVSCGEIKTLTLAFEEFSEKEEDEAPLAAQVARTYETNHSTRVVTRGEFVSDLPKIIDAMDQPSIDGVNTWFVSKAAHELGLKVAISGVGGDELFGGYSSFHDIPKWLRWFKLTRHFPNFARKCRRAISALPIERAGISPKAPGLLELGGTLPGAYLLRRGVFMLWELHTILDQESLAEGVARLNIFDRIADELSPPPNSAVAKVATLESTLYLRHQLLRDADWASMAHSLEVRTPLVDAMLLQRVAGLAITSGSKAPLAYSPNRALPETVLTRRKTGFTVPLGAWMGLTRGVPARSTLSQSRAWARRLIAMADISAKDTNLIHGKVTTI